MPFSIPPVPRKSRRLTEMNLLSIVVNKHAIKSFSFKEPSLNKLQLFFPALPAYQFGLLSCSSWRIDVWFAIKKEEMPDFETNWIRISAAYPGANASDVERLVIFLEIEKRLRSVSGIEEINSEASPGRASIRVNLYQQS